MRGGGPAPLGWGRGAAAPVYGEWGRVGAQGSPHGCPIAVPTSAGLWVGGLSPLTPQGSGWLWVGYLSAP